MYIRQLFLCHCKNNTMPRQPCGNFIQSVNAINFTGFTNLRMISYLLMSNNKDRLQWMMGQGLFQSDMKCVTCGSDCTHGKRTRKVDGYIRRCQNSKNHEISISKFSFFDSSHIRLPDISQFTRCILQHQ